MKLNRMTVLAVATLLVCLASGLAHAEKKVKVKGIITGRTGENLTLRTTNGNVTVALDDDTKVQQPKGLGIRKKEMSAAVLIPGLKVTVEGSGDSDTQITAQSITFDKDDLQTAEMIQAGLTPTAAQVKNNQENIATNQQDIKTNQEGVAANTVQLASQQDQIQQNKMATQANQQDIAENAKRFSQLADYDTKGEATVNFGVGSSTLSPDAKSRLQQLAQSATGLSGYLIEVMGYADSSGNASMNQQLSMDRAQEVIAYLQQDCKIPIRHIVAPGAMGEADPAGSNETAQGRAENRRVDVKVLVNRGVNGS
jgi:OmpA-OmpF porin, OOP family